MQPEGKYVLPGRGPPLPIDGAELARVSVSNGSGPHVFVHGHISKVGKEEL